MSDQHDAVAGWEAHLRAGGRTPWLDFLATGAVAEGGAPTDAVAPSAVHLELLRRLDGDLPDFGDLADLVLTTPTPGRGSVDIPLLVPESTPSHGAPAVDPSRLPAHELLRLAVGVLARLIDTTPPAPAPRSLARRILGQHRRFRTTGSPMTAQRVRRAFLDAGWVEGRGGRLLSIDTGPANAVLELWVQRTLDGRTEPWSKTWRRVELSGGLPRRAATGRRIEHYAGRPAEVAEQVRRRHGVEVDDDAPDLVAIELIRHLNAALAVRIPAALRRAVTPRIVDVIGRADPGITGLSVPGPRHPWASRTLGIDPTNYAHLPDGITDPEVLDLALPAIGRAWRARRGTDQQMSRKDQ